MNNNPYTPSLLQKIGVNRTVNEKEKARLGNLASGVKTKLMELETGGPVLYWVGYWERVLIVWVGNSLTAFYSFVCTIFITFPLN